MQLQNATIIAEVGVNHNGSVSIAKKLVEKAKYAGADIVKFQTFNAGKLASKQAEMAEYQKKNTGKTESQREMLKKMALCQNDFIKLSEYSKEIGISFLSTPFDIESIHFLNNIQNMWKIPSGEITNYPYLIEIAKTGKPIIMSTGMAEMREVEEAIGLLRNHGSGEISLLQCTTDYPTPYEDVNLKAMLTMRDRFGCLIGYSDHTKGIEIAIAARAMGASIIEKHFTLDRNMEGPDHKASLEPDDLAAMVKAIRNVEKAMGSGEKKPSPSEVKNKEVARKSIIARCNIKRGEIFTENNITTKRPGNGISPMRWKEILGTRAVRDFEEDELIEI